MRKRVEHAGVGAYFPSLSTRTVVYKGMLAPTQLRGFFPDLIDERLESRIALVHSRFSTNTFPSWPLAHPYRLIAHNGEINTLAGNRNWMRAREAFLASDRFDGDMGRLFPIVTPGASDSATFDEVLELLHLAGRTLPHAVLMMIPEAWQNHTEMDAARRAFYSFHASLMEPWDGPAAIAFTDGTVVGAVLDRNGLRPARYWVTDDGLVVLASEVGVLDLDPASVILKGRLQPGRMFLVDTSAGRIVSDDEIKASLAAEHPYGEWLAKSLVHLWDLPTRIMLTPQHASVVAGSPLLYVPAVYWDYCRTNVMVMERIHGIIVSRSTSCGRTGTNIAKLAENGVEIFFTQVFRHNFFHADMHPGNIFVQIDDPQNPRYAAVDFGIVGTLQPRDQHYLAENFLAFFDRDYARVAALHVESGWVPQGTRVDELESAVRTVCEPIFNKPLKEISFAQVLLRLFETARRFDMEIQPQLMLLQKTLLNIEGLGRELYPELDLWKTAQPVLRAWMRERMSPRTVLRRMRTQLPIPSRP